MGHVALGASYKTLLGVEVKELLPPAPRRAQQPPRGRVYGGDGSAFPTPAPRELAEVLKRSAAQANLRGLRWSRGKRVAAPPAPRKGRPLASSCPTPLPPPFPEVASSGLPPHARPAGGAPGMGKRRARRQSPGVTGRPRGSREPYLLVGRSPPSAAAALRRRRPSGDACLGALRPGPVHGWGAPLSPSPVRLLPRPPRSARPACLRRCLGSGSGSQEHRAEPLAQAPKGGAPRPLDASFLRRDPAPQNCAPPLPGSGTGHPLCSRRGRNGILQSVGRTPLGPPPPPPHPREARRHRHFQGGQAGRQLVPPAVEAVPQPGTPEGSPVPSALTDSKAAAPSPLPPPGRALRLSQPPVVGEGLLAAPPDGLRCVCVGGVSLGSQPAFGRGQEGRPEACQLHGALAWSQGRPSRRSARSAARPGPGLREGKGAWHLPHPLWPGRARRAVRKPRPGRQRTDAPPPPKGGSYSQATDAPGPRAA
ncbi:basic proline-rich protein-like [Sphaerodactylus townsendi]|uniref:basic proline-rich protein-like n=1 Tax=Sphaerodactylus townsendi TaxID=933632 RepID=UPI0020268585|nr:basic proline-rich protein-like [Sphaerodactylus townsendi]